MQVMSSSSPFAPPCTSPEAIASSFGATVDPLFAQRTSGSQGASPQDVWCGSADSGAEPVSQKPTNLRSPKRPNICGFFPLPPISASPSFTPTQIFPSQGDHSKNKVVSPPSFTDDLTSDISTPPYKPSRHLFPDPTPTWIATPPTPPPRPPRKLNKVLAHCSFSSPFLPSASFTALMNPHAEKNANHGLKRCTSLPILSPRSGGPAEVSTRWMDAQPPQTQVEVSLVNNPFDATFYLKQANHGPTRRQGRSGSHSQPIFHLSTRTIDATRGSSRDQTADPPLETPSPDGSWSDQSTDDICESERIKDAHRKFHALKELLDTEVGYLADLAALVTIYLRNLPTLAARPLVSSSTFGRASASFTSGPWMHSYTQLQAAALSSSTTLPETQNLPSLVPVPPKELQKPTSRYLFSDAEIESLTRNAEEILQVHEQFIWELRTLLAPLGFFLEGGDAEEVHVRLAHLDEAIRAVSAKFATEASRFNAYQFFCAGHPEALDIVRKALQQYPLEFDAFEHRCASMVADTHRESPEAQVLEALPSSSRSSTDSPTSQSQVLEDRKRAMSLTSLDGAVRSLRPRSSLAIMKDTVSFPTEGGSSRGRRKRRIAFMDYLIKPIQRICKYPLLLDQLLPSKALRALSQDISDVDVVVESAAQAMRHVATSVDEARHRQNIAVQSSLIFSRISVPPSSAPGMVPSQSLTSDFLSSLGTCHLSGSLDVMHYHPNRPLAQTSNIKAKYLGAFLYPGGYLILVKVSKGRKYEPRHWLSLSDFDISDVGDAGAMLPCSFRLSSAEQHFELAAACKREKDAWLSSIHESLTHAPIWASEPVPSYRLDGKGELLRGSDDGHCEAPNGLPTIRSIPELCNGSDTEFSEPFFASLRMHGRTRKRQGYEPSLTQKPEIPAPPSRRSSSTSVKAIFSPMSSDTKTVVIRRSSPIARLQVDQELRDVISQSCLTARSYAYSHEEVLFQPPKDGFSRSNSTMSMAGMARLSKHESVRVPRRRTTDGLDSVANLSSPPSNALAGMRQRNAKRLGLTPITANNSNSTSSPCPSAPSSQTSSKLPSIRSSYAPSSPSPTPPSRASSEHLPLKPRSFVRNVKGLFQFRPAPPISPVSVIVTRPSQPSAQSPAPLASQNLIPNNIAQRWPWDSHRLRPRGAYDEPVHEGTTIDDPDKSYPITPSRAVTPLSS